MRSYQNRVISILALLLFSLPGFLTAQNLPLEGELERGSVLDIRIDTENKQTAALLQSWDGNRYFCLWSPAGDLLKSTPIDGNVLGLWKKSNQWLTVELAEIFANNDSRQSPAPVWSRVLNVSSNETVLDLPPSQIISRALDYGLPLNIADGIYHLGPKGRFLTAEYWLGKQTVKIDEKAYDSEFQIIDLEKGTLLFSRLFHSGRDSFLPRGRFSPRITVSFSNDGTQIILAGTEQITGLYSLETGERTAVFINPLDDPYFLFLPDEKIIQYNHYSRKCKIYSQQGGLPEKVFNHGLRYPAIYHSYIISIFDDGYQLFELKDSHLEGISFTYFDPMRSAFFLREREENHYRLFPRAFSERSISYRQVIIPEADNG